MPPWGQASEPSHSNLQKLEPRAEEGYLSGSHTAAEVVSRCHPSLPHGVAGVFKQVLPPFQAPVLLLGTKAGARLPLHRVPGAPDRLLEFPAPPSGASVPLCQDETKKLDNRSLSLQAESGGPGKVSEGEDPGRIAVGSDMTRARKQGRQVLFHLLRAHDHPWQSEGRLFGGVTCRTNYGLR